MLLRKAGLEEAFNYLQVARIRLYSGEPTGFADCKTNCRKALVSAIKAITGKENIREGVRIMAKQGYFGKTEEEFIATLENPLAKIYNLASKKGPHIPLPTFLESEFTLRLTEATVEFLAKLKINQMLEMDS